MCFKVTKMWGFLDKKTNELLDVVLPSRSLARDIKKEYQSKLSGHRVVRIQVRISLLPEELF